MKIKLEESVEKTEEDQMESNSLLTEKKFKLKTFLQKKRQRQELYISKKIRYAKERIDEDAKF